MKAIDDQQILLLRQQGLLKKIQKVDKQRKQKITKFWKTNREESKLIKHASPHPENYLHYSQMAC